MPIVIAGRNIGGEYPVYIVAELSANHRNNFDIAVETIVAMKEAGADAVKVQTYTPDTITIDCDSDYFRIQHGTLWDGRSLHDLYREAYMPWEWQPKLKEVADDLGLDFFSSPFDKTAVDFLERMNVPAYKIASFELVDIPLIQYAASKRKPLIMSTGMANLQEIDEAVSAARKVGCKEIALLKCTSAYPADPSEINLRTIPDMNKMFNLPVGLSDHTLGIAVPVSGVAIGACIVEKHFTLSRGIPGPDSAFSLEPDEFRAMVDGVRIAQRAMGSVKYQVSDSESGNRGFRRSLFVVEDMKAGDVFTEENVKSIRPGAGLPPKYLEKILGMTSKDDIKRGTPLSWHLISQQG
ncbi:MAG: pseudaminic acid synthase [Desulfobacteraceae bacterium]|nr:MAG: pseudaminic acid synthase [Desulfobacteraceae bacterium]